MSASKKRCSGCKHFLRLYKFGFCNLFDAKADSGYSCSKWKGVKYKRDKGVQLIKVTDN